MKHIQPTPLGISRTSACAELYDPAEQQVDPARIPPVLAASQAKRKAKFLLDLPGKEHRLQLILAELLVIFLSLAVPMILDCLSFLIYTLPYFTDIKNLTWLVILRGVLWGANVLLIALPLLCGLYRVAVLMVRDSEDTAIPIGAWECFYPFTSWRAYTRTLYVGIRALFRLILTLLPPVGILAGAVWGLPLLGKYCPLILCTVLWMLAIAAACFALLGMALWNAHGAGLDYLVLAYPEQSLFELSDAFRSAPRRASTPLLMRLSLAVWFLLSMLAVLLPLLLHTLPYILLTEAVYGQSLENICLLKSQEESVL